MIGPARTTHDGSPEPHAACHPRPLDDRYPSFVAEEDIAVGASLIGRGGARIGTVDAVFADYLLVRTASLLPIDLYVPRPDVAAVDGKLRVDCSRSEAYERWHRPLKRAPHGER